MSDEANLGCATTRELLEELLARAEMATSSFPHPVALSNLRVESLRFLRVLPDSVLDYRTVDQ